MNQRIDCDAILATTHRKRHASLAKTLNRMIDGPSPLSPERRLSKDDRALVLDIVCEMAIGRALAQHRRLQQNTPAKHRALSEVARERRELKEWRRALLSLRDRSLNQPLVISPDRALVADIDATVKLIAERIRKMFRQRRDAERDAIESLAA
jgi:hypothetical protein